MTIFITVYLLSLIIGLWSVICDYKEHCRVRCRPATVEGLLNDDDHGCFTVMCFIPGLNILSAITLLIAVLYERIKNVKL